MMILVPIFVAAITCQTAGPGVLVGRWESHDTSKGGIGHVIDFRNDGSFVESTSVLVKLRYELHNDQLTVRDPAAGKDSEQPPVASVRFEGDTLIQDTPGGPSIRRERIGLPDPKGPTIVGPWRYRHYTGAMAFERYTADGDLFFRLPMTSSTGCYTSDPEKHQVLLAPLKGDEKTLRFTADAAQLRLESPGRPGTVYDLSPLGAWYDIDNIDFHPPTEQP